MGTFYENYHFPNVRDMFIPDPGYVIIDTDLERADAQCVAWYAGDEKLKQVFRSGADLHLENAKSMYNNDTLTKHSPERQMAKNGIHAINYGTKERTLAATLKISVQSATAFKQRWFSAHPEIEQWHKDVWHILRTKNQAMNIWGYRKHYFDRIEEQLLPQALAFLGQSTVAIAVDEIWKKMRRELRNEFQVLLQVHDSFVGQVHHSIVAEVVPIIRECMAVVVPFPDPLIIGSSLKVSEKSWGTCRPWDEWWADVESGNVRLAA
jgi:DNA polymerase-1